MIGMRGVTLAAAIGLGFEGHMGGWAVISVENPPEVLEAGTSYTIEYTVRQHGVEPLNGLQGHIEITPASGKTMIMQATRASKPGRYKATFEVPATERVVVMVASGFGPPRHSSLTLAPVAVVRRGDPRPAMASAERGRVLFVAKGCGTCHVNNDVPEWGDNRTLPDYGPNLTGRKLAAQYVRQRITNPASLPPIGGDKVRMPNLGLAEPEVAALVAFLSGPEQRAGL